MGVQGKILEGRETCEFGNKFLSGFTCRMMRWGLTSDSYTSGWSSHFIFYHINCEIYTTKLERIIYITSISFGLHTIHYHTNANRNFPSSVCLMIIFQHVPYVGISWINHTKSVWKSCRIFFCNHFLWLTSLHTVIGILKTDFVTITWG